jgi:protoporphyrinogen/coproporphyrinogen III oxidase
VLRHRDVAASCAFASLAVWYNLQVVGHIYKTVVIGGGLSGLACAFRLRQLGIPALVLEASDRAGGMVSTVKRNGFVFEAGPQCPRFPASVWNLVRELNLESEFVAGDPKAKRYILRDGRLHLAPFSPGGALTTRLLGLRSKYRLFSEVLRNSQPPAAEESLAEFVERKFGGEVLDYLVDPFVATVFFSDAQKMGMQSAFPDLVKWEQNSGSVVRGALRAYRSKRAALQSSAGPSRGDSSTNRGGLYVTDALPALGSFQGGMGTLAMKLAEKLGEDVHFGAKVESVAQAGDGTGRTQIAWQIRVSGGEEFSAEAIVLAVPAYAAASLLQQGASRLAALLATIEHAPMGVVSSAYDRKHVRHPLDGFGFMVPRREGLHTVCTFWNSSLFPGHAPKGSVLMTSFVRTDTGGLMSAPYDVFAQMVEAENSKILGITGAPVERTVWRYPRALPQYNVGHAQRAKEIREAESALPGLGLAGNYLSGRSLGDCAESGFQAAETLRNRMRS